MLAREEYGMLQRAASELIVSSSLGT